MTTKEKAMLQKLKDERVRLVRQAEALQNELRGLDRAITLCEADASTPRQKPKNVKDAIVKIMDDAGLIGATVDEVVTSAKNAGVHLERGTVASTLSRFKRDGTLEAKDGRYFLRLRPSVPTGDAYAPITAH